MKHGVLDERLNVHGVQGLKVADLSVCPDNVGCNTYSTALLIGEKCAMLVGEDLGYKGSDLDMKVCLSSPSFSSFGGGRLILVTRYRTIMLQANSRVLLLRDYESFA